MAKSSNADLVRDDNRWKELQEIMQMLNATGQQLDGFDVHDDEEHAFLQLARRRLPKESPGVYDSHGKRLMGYRLMVERWRSTGSKETLAPDEIKKIIG